MRRAFAGNAAESNKGGIGGVGGCVARHFHTTPAWVTRAARAADATDAGEGGAGVEAVTDQVNATVGDRCRCRPKHRHRVHSAGPDWRCMAAAVKAAESGR